MSRRVFVTVTRGMTDKTAVCVFPWEIALLSHVHGQEVKVVSIDEMCDMQGAVKIEKVKLNHGEKHAPAMREQFEAMCRVDPDNDPCNDAAAEYNRMIEKYGMDSQFPIPVVERIYGQFGKAFEAVLEEQDVEGDAADPRSMSRVQLRAALTARKVPWKATESKESLAVKLEQALEPA